jgi:hypothetical protein
MGVGSVRALYRALQLDVGSMATKLEAWLADVGDAGCDNTTASVTGLGDLGSVSLHVAAAVRAVLIVADRC